MLVYPRVSFHRFQLRISHTWCMALADGFKSAPPQLCGALMFKKGKIRNILIPILATPLFLRRCCIIYIQRKFESETSELRIFRMWRNDCLGVWMSESLDVWKFECLKVWMSESLNDWKLEMSESLNVWNSGCLKVWMSESLNDWKYGCLKDWISESLDVWKL